MRDLRCFALLLSLSSCLAACGTEDIAPRTLDTPTGAPGIVHGGPTGSTAPKCELGERRLCSYTLGVHNGIHDCVAGAQICLGKDWGPCEEGVSLDGGALPDGGYFQIEGGPVDGGVDASITN